MDKEETAVEITKLQSRVDTLEKAKERWDNIVRDTIVQSVKWLVLAGLAGVLSGWHLSENFRKAVLDWMSK